MNPLDWIGKKVTVKIDRPIGSRHPQHGFVYPLNYGYLPGTRAADGEEIDAYVVAVPEPVQEFNGVCIAVIQRNDDDDDKLVVAPAGLDFSDEQIRGMTDFQEKWFTSTILRK